MRYHHILELQDQGECLVRILGRILFFQNMAFDSAIATTLARSVALYPILVSIAELAWPLWCYIQGLG